MNRGFYGRIGLVGMGYASGGGGMGVSPFPIPPALYQCAPFSHVFVASHSAESTSVAKHSMVSSVAASHSEASAVVENDQ
jgi:hypothetical protein